MSYIFYVVDGLGNGYLAQLIKVDVSSVFLELTDLSLSARMRSSCIVFFIIFLSWSLVEVNSQTFPYVSFMDHTLGDHSYVDLRLVERPDRPRGGHSVECHTYLTTCCNQTVGRRSM